MSNNIGTFEKLDDNSYTGTISTLQLPNLGVSLVPVPTKKDREPDYQIMVKSENGPVRIGSGWITEAKTSGQVYINCAFNDPSFTPFYARLVQFEGEDTHSLMVS